MATARLLRIVVAIILAAALAGTASCSSVPSAAADGQSAVATSTPVSSPGSFPTSARRYAEAVLAAWSDGQSTRLAELITPEALTQLHSAESLAGPWFFLACDGVAGASSCQLVDLDGDAVTLRLDNQLAKAHAVIGVTLDLTTYPANAIEYVKAFIEAWRTDNSARMSTLATHEVTDFFLRYGPPASYSTCALLADGVASVRVYNSAILLNDTLLVSVAALGGKHAITERALTPADCS